MKRQLYFFILPLALNLIVALQPAQAQITTPTTPSSHSYLGHHRTQARAKPYSQAATKSYPPSKKRNPEQDYEQKIIRYAIQRMNQIKTFEELAQKIPLSKDHQRELESLIKLNKIGRAPLPKIHSVGNNQILVENNKNPIPVKFTFKPKAALEIYGQTIIYQGLPFNSLVQKVSEALTQKNTSSDFLFKLLLPSSYAQYFVPDAQKSSLTLKKDTIEYATLISLFSDLIWNQFIHCQEDDIKLTHDQVNCLMTSTQNLLQHNFDFLKSRKLFLPNEINCQENKLNKISAGPTGISFVYSNDKLTEMKVRNPPLSLIHDCHYELINNKVVSKEPKDCPLSINSDFIDIAFLPISRMMDCCKEGESCTTPINNYLLENRNSRPFNPPQTQSTQ